MKVPVSTTVVGFSPILLNLSLVGINLVRKVLLLTITGLAPVSRHISILLVSARDRIEYLSSIDMDKVGS